MGEMIQDKSVVAMGDGRETADAAALAAVMACRERGEAVALVTVIGATGSAPRGMGATMAVRKDGSIVGTIGGGNLELFTIRHALASIEDGCPRRLHYDFSGGPEQNVSKACCGTTDFFIQPFTEMPRLVVFGAGHVARALVPQARACGFSVLVADDRQDFLDAASFPEGTEFLCGLFAETAASAPLDETTYAVIMTYGHVHDEEVLAACLNRPWKYLGLMASRAKVAELKAHIGTTDEARRLLEKVRMPVGLDIGGRSPAEIAVSIMGEIIAERYGRRKNV